MRYSAFFTIFILLVVMSCKSQKNSASEEETNAQESSGLTLLMTDNYGGSESEVMTVYKSQGELNKFFAKVNRTRKPGIKPPPIDFKKNMAVIYCPGKTRINTPVELYSRNVGEKGIAISAKRSELSGNQESTAVLMPFGLYIMPLTDKDISLQK